MKNTVLVGLGAIYPMHLAPVLEMGVLYGVCDIVKEKADENARKYNCKAFYNFDDVVSDRNVDCVHILTPHYLHFPMAKKASEAGKTVVLEKPAVMNTKEFKELTKVFRDNGTKNLVIFQNRYNPCIEYLKENFGEIEKELGGFLGSKGILTWQRDEKYYSSGEWRGKYETEGGGLLINQAPHIIDLLLYFGGELERVEGASKLHVLKNIIEVEDTSEAVLWFRNGTRSIFYGTNGYVTNSPYDMEFAFKKGVIRYMYNKLYKICGDEITELCHDAPGAGKKDYWGNSHKTLIKKFYNGGECTDLSDYETVCHVIETLVDTKRKDDNK